MLKRDAAPEVLFTALPLMRSNCMRPQSVLTLSPTMTYWIWSVLLSQMNFVAAAPVALSRTLMLLVRTRVVGTGEGSGVGCVVGGIEGSAVGDS